MYSSPKFFVPMTTVCDGAACAADQPISSATPIATANAALAARRVCFRIMGPLLSGRGSLTLPTSEAPGRHGSLDRRQRQVDAEGERDRADGGAEHPRKP